MPTPTSMTNTGVKPPVPALTNATVPPTTASHFTNDTPAMPTHTGGAKKSKSKKVKATTSKKHLCGRERLVTKEGRSSFVVIKGTKVSLTKAKEMDAKYKKAKKEAEAKKPVKKSRKSTKTAKSSSASRSASQRSTTQRTSQRSA